MSMMITVVSEECDFMLPDDRAFRNAPSGPRDRDRDRDRRRSEKDHRRSRSRSRSRGAAAAPGPGPDRRRIDEEVERRIESEFQRRVEKEVVHRVEVEVERRVKEVLSSHVVQQQIQQKLMAARAKLEEEVCAGVRRGWGEVEGSVFGPCSRSTCHSTRCFPVVESPPICTSTAKAMNPHAPRCFLCFISKSLELS
jgi:hypothetical protein